MTAKVLVVMSAYNGERFIAEQIESILKQKNVEITLLIRDDGSTDGTPDIIRGYAQKNRNIVFIPGNNVGFRASFFNTLVDEKNVYDYYAFSDQDDYWEPEKLDRAIKMIERVDKENVLYTSALRVVDENLNPMYTNQYKKLRISFGSALSRQRLAGCTMVFDRSLKKLCEKFRIRQEMKDAISHDAAVYYICLLTGGTVLFDENSHILYRRHSGTVTEHGLGFIKRVNSVTAIFHENSRQKLEQVKLLNGIYGGDISEENRPLVDEILQYQKGFANTLRLAMDGRIRCGLFSVDVVNLLAILTHNY